MRHRLPARGTAIAIALALTVAWCGAVAAKSAAAARTVATARTAAKPAAAVVPVRTGLENLEKSVEEFTLPNGLRFILIERHDAPVFSFETRVNAGGAQEVPGTTGIAHMMEHMAFKGTELVGTKDYAAEAPLLAAEEKAWQAVLDEERKGIHTDSTRLASLTAAFKAAQDKARELVKSNEYSAIIEQNGGQDFNAQTSADWTRYFYSIPSNRLELWASMEGGRMAFPVFREFYKERDVVYEERRMRTESSPIGRLFEQYTQAAYVAHPYGYGVIGFPSDLSTFTRTEGEQFYRGHYVAKNMAVAVVGDVSLDDLKGMATKYWQDVSSAPAPPELDVKEPEQKAERRVILEDPAQPYVVIGWHCPAFTDPRFPAYDALADLLGGGDYSRLYKRLVKEKKICVQAAAFTGYPGQKYPGLLSIITVPASGQDPLAVEREVYATLDEIQKTRPFTDEELTGYKVRTRADLVHQCEDNQSLASALAEAQILYGDWHEFFRGVERAQKLAPQDLLEAMKASLTRENRTVALIENPKPESSTPTGGGR